MNRDQLYEFMAEFFAKAEALSRRKNADYAQDADPFQNFSQHGEKGFVTRMSDKMTRLGNLIDREIKDKILSDAGVQPPTARGVVDESIEDTLLDLFNYCWLMTAYRRTLAENEAPPVDFRQPPTLPDICLTMTSTSDWGTEMFQTPPMTSPPGAAACVGCLAGDQGPHDLCPCEENIHCTCIQCCNITDWCAPCGRWESKCICSICPECGAVD